MDGEGQEPAGQPYKPKGSLGELEEIAARAVAIMEKESPPVKGKGVFIFVGDHGAVSDGVSAYPQEVTGLMVRNFLSGGAAINVLTRRAGASVSVIDIGMKEDLPDAEGLIKKNIKRATGNIAEGPAMTREEAEEATGPSLTWKGYDPFFIWDFGLVKGRGRDWQCRLLKTH